MIIDGYFNYKKLYREVNFDTKHYTIILDFPLSFILILGIITHLPYLPTIDNFKNGFTCYVDED